MFNFRTNLLDERVTVFDDRTAKNEAEDVCPDIAIFVQEWSSVLDNNDDASDRLIRPLLPELTGTCNADSYVAQADAELRRTMAISWELRARVPSFLKLVPALEDHAKVLEGVDELLDARQMMIALRAVEDAESAALEAMVSARYSPSCALARNAGLFAQAETGATAVDKLAKRRSGLARGVTKLARRAAVWATTWHLREIGDTDALATLGAVVERGQASAAELVKRLCAVGR